MLVGSVNVRYHNEHVRVYVAVQIFASPRESSYPPFAYPFAGNYTVGSPFYEDTNVSEGVRQSLPTLPSRLLANRLPYGWEWIGQYRNAVHPVRLNAIAENYWINYRAWLVGLSGHVYGHGAWYDTGSRFNPLAHNSHNNGRLTSDILPHQQLLG